MPLTKERISFLMKDATQRFTKYIGYTPVSMEQGKAIAIINIQEHHLQQDGFVHAGVIATMADHTAGYAAFTMVPENRRILTIEYKINFLKPAKGDLLECRSRVIKPGSTILVTESEVFARENGDKTLTAKAMLTMAAVPKDKLKKTDEKNKQ